MLIRWREELLLTRLAIDSTFKRCFQKSEVFKKTGVSETSAAPAAAIRRVVPRPSPLRSHSSGRQVPRCRATDVPLDGERRATACLVAHAALCDCASGAVVKMPSLAARAVPPVSVARLARCLVRPGWLNGVRCWARAQRHGGV